MCSCWLYWNYSASRIEKARTRLSSDLSDYLNERSIWKRTHNQTPAWLQPLFCDSRGDWKLERYQIETLVYCICILKRFFPAKVQFCHPVDPWLPTYYFAGKQQSDSADHTPPLLKPLLHGSKTRSTQNFHASHAFPLCRLTDWDFKQNNTRI